MKMIRKMRVKSKVAKNEYKFWSREAAYKILSPEKLINIASGKEFKIIAIEFKLDENQETTKEINSVKIEY